MGLSCFLLCAERDGVVIAPSSDFPLSNPGINKRKSEPILELRPNLNFSCSFTFKE